MAGRDTALIREAKEKGDKQDFRFYSGGISQGLQPSWKSVGADRASSIPAAARRGCGGPELQGSRVLGSESPRKVEHRLKCEKIRQGGQDTAVVEPVVVRKCGILSMVSPEPRGGLSGNSCSTRSMNCSLSGPKPSTFCIEVFAGTARITSALRDRGLHCLPLDICISPEHDVLDATVEHCIFNWIRGRRVKFVWIGMPCTSFSAARKADLVGPGPLRSSSEPFGVAGLSRTDWRKVKQGNLLMYFTIRLIRLCDAFEIPYVLENPSSSRAWTMPPMQNMIQQYRPQFVNLDYCQYGEQWKKPTTLIFKFLDLQPLAVKCTGVNGYCSKSKRPHIPLTGRDTDGIFWTLKAQPYPLTFSSAVAHIVANAL